MLNFVICDDSQVVIDRLESILNRIFAIQDINARVAFKSTNPYKVLEYVNSHSVNILTIDIDLKTSLNGLELANKIRETNKSMYFMFITGHPEYMSRAIEYKTFAFLTKPLSPDELSRTVKRLVSDIEGSPKQFINVDKSNKVYIDGNDINYIKKDAMKLVYITNNHEYESYNSFNKIENSLPAQFVRCHKSYIVNVNNIRAINANNIIEFNNNDTCEIGPKYKNKMMEVIKNYGNFSNNLDCFNHRKWKYM